MKARLAALPPAARATIALLLVLGFGCVFNGQGAFFRAELHLGLEKLRTELIERIEQGFRSQTWKLIGALIASQSTTIAAIALFVR